MQSWLSASQCFYSNATVLASHGMNMIVDRLVDFVLKKKKNKKHPNVLVSIFMFNFFSSGISGTGEAFSLFSPNNFKNKFQKGICPFPHGIFKNVLGIRRKESSPQRWFTKFMT